MVIFFTIILSLLIIPNSRVFCEDNVINITYLSDEGLDTNGNGLFNFLEIKIEANISYSGFYMLESRALIDPSGQQIEVSAFKEIYLESGDHIFNILFDGRIIYISGMNPINVSYVSLISEDFKMAGFLNNMPLSRVYNFTEFENPPEYYVGISEGDWIRYHAYQNLTHVGSTENESIDYPQEILVNVTGIKDKIVTVDLNFLYKNGENQKEVAEDFLEKNSDIYPFIIPSNLSSEDSSITLGNINIKNTISADVLGNDRELNHNIGKYNFSQTNAKIFMDEEYFWDRKTGILIKSWLNYTIIDLITGIISHNNVSFTIWDTNVIPQKTRIVMEAPTNIQLGNLINFNITLFNYHNEGMGGKTILVYSGDDGEKIGEGVTDSDGRLKIEYRPKKSGEQMIKSTFVGSEEYLAAENLIKLNVKDPYDFQIQLIVIMVLLLILSTSIIIIVKKPFHIFL